MLFNRQRGEENPPRHAAPGSPPVQGDKPGGKAANGNGRDKPSVDTTPPDRVKLGIARYLAWVLLVLILAFSIFLAIVVGNRAQDTLLTKQRNFAGILAEHLNQQIFARFSIPAVAAYGRPNLKQNAQYVMLDQTVASLTHGLQVHSLRIFDNDGEIKYSSRDRGEVGHKSPVTEAMVQGVEEAQLPVFVVDRNIPLWEAYLSFFRMKPGAFYLRTIAPMRPVVSLRVSNTASYEWTRAESLGVLEFSQDITSDMADIVRFQWTIVGITLASSLLVVLLLLVFLRRAEAALALRMRERQRLVSELHQHEKLAGMGRVVAGIAHEIRNPLGIIQSSAELLLSRPTASDPVTGKILRAIFDEARRLSQTVSDFLDYARPRQPQQAQVDLARTTRDVLAFLEPELAARNITVRTAFVPQRAGTEGLYTLGDKDLLHRAIYNVLINSMQAMDTKGSITISGRPLEEKTRDRVELCVADSGPGFPVENRERILDPFVTTKDGGTGLGLPIVNNIITSHGGQMSLEDAPGGGAMVRMVLPSGAS
ncbi:Integral membrane sensor signal transduction histidine kinase [uncultured delta proteobacterium]|uniref:histidine kinase n=1 Tax=uncultured delta proteobacterium TaxID=34034 RepID=A0A212IVK3_9DELT|nr:Integral membrane sensor signal transduction histidine kinase [uncultured delta proteobacterium]